MAKVLSFELRQKQFLIKSYSFHLPKSFVSYVINSYDLFLITGKLNPYVLSFVIRSSWRSRKSNNLERSVNIAPNALPLPTVHFLFSNQVSMDGLCTIAFPKSTLLLRQNVIQKISIQINIILSKAFDVCRILTANFKQNGNLTKKKQ